jgi:hypothetical protein
MPKRIRVSPEDLDWLRNAIAEKRPLPEMAARLGCCLDTLKRILMRHGLADFPGAKYQLRRDANVQKWNRPCMGCGSTETRPKWWYFCTACRRKRGFHEASEDEW